MFLKAVRVYTVETEVSRIVSALATQALKALGFGKPSLGNIWMTSDFLISAQFQSRTQIGNNHVTLDVSNKMQFQSEAKLFRPLGSTFFVDVGVYLRGKRQCSKCALKLSHSGCLDCIQHAQTPEQFWFSTLDAKLLHFSDSEPTLNTYSQWPGSMNVKVKLLSLRFPRLSSQSRHMATSEGAKWEHLRRDITVTDRKHRAIRLTAKKFEPEKSFSFFFSAQGLWIILKGIDTTEHLHLAYVELNVFSKGSCSEEACRLSKQQETNMATIQNSKVAEADGQLLPIKPHCKWWDRCQISLTYKWREFTPGQYSRMDFNTQAFYQW